MANRTARMGAHVAPSQYRPYYESLDHLRRQAYDAVLAGLLRFKGSIPLPHGLDQAFVGNLRDHMERDVPELFFVDCASTACDARTGEPLRMLPRYRSDEEETLAIARRMEAAAARLLRDAMQRAFDDRIELVHNRLINHFSYSEANDLAHAAAGPLAFGQGVCDGVSKAFKYLCDRCCVRSQVVLGDASNGDIPLAAMARGGDPSHAWNLVDFGEANASSVRGATALWRHVDVTFDGGLSETLVRHDYFGLSDDEASVDHELHRSPLYPTCPTSSRYYQRKHCFVTGASQLRALVKSELSRQIPQASRASSTWPPRAPGLRGTRPPAQTVSLLFQTPPIAANEEEVRARLSQLVAHAVALPERRVALSVSSNRERMVFQMEIGFDQP